MRVNYNYQSIITVTTVKTKKKVYFKICGLRVGPSRNKHIETF